jgi:sporulation protein YlmC with PRC-barrel domain
MHLTDITGKAVLSVSTGARLGRVVEVLLDPRSLAIAAFVVAVDRQQAVIPFDQVQSVGSDAVMVPDADVARWIATASETETLITFDALKRYKVIDAAGTLLGTPQALDLDPTDGRLQQNPSRSTSVVSG